MNRRCRLFVVFALFVGLAISLAGTTQAAPASYTVTVRTDRKGAEQLCETLQAQGYSIGVSGEGEYTASAPQVHEDLSNFDSLTVWERITHGIPSVSRADLERYLPYGILAVAVTLGLYAVAAVMRSIRRRSIERGYFTDYDEPIAYSRVAATADAREGIATVNLSQRLAGINGQPFFASSYVAVASTPYEQPHLTYPAFNQSNQYSIIRSSMNPRR